MPLQAAFLPHLYEIPDNVFRKLNIHCEVHGRSGERGRRWAGSSGKQLLGERLKTHTHIIPLLKITDP